MAEYTIRIKPPEQMDLTITGSDSQQLKLEPKEFQQITVDYEGDTLIFQGKKINAVASLKCISDVFWMILSLTSKGFDIEPNEPQDILRKLKLK